MPSPAGKARSTRGMKTRDRRVTSDRAMGWAQMETRRLMLALFISLAVYFAYTWLYNRLFPPPKPVPTSGPTVTNETGPAAAPSSAPAADAASAPSTIPAGRLVSRAASTLEPLTIGGGPA